MEVDKEVGLMEVGLVEVGLVEVGLVEVGLMEVGLMMISWILGLVGKWEEEEEEVIKDLDLVISHLIGLKKYLEISLRMILNLE